MTLDRRLAVTGLAAGVAVLALGVSQTGFTIRPPEYLRSERHCLSYERKGHLQALPALTTVLIPSLGLFICGTSQGTPVTTLTRAGASGDAQASAADCSFASLFITRVGSRS